MALLSYNSVNLPYCHLQRCTVESVDDDLSHTDMILTKFDIQVQTIICADALDMIAPDLIDVTDNPATIMQRIQTALLTRRKKLSFTFDEVEFIPQPAGVRGYVDAKNGPTPQSCEIVRMDEAAWLVTYHIVAHYVVNYALGATRQLGGAGQINDGRVRYTNLPTNVVLFNRWEESVSIDDCEYSTRTRKGRCMIRSDNQLGVLADEVRSTMAVVSIPSGFLRTKADYTISPDGLGLAYNIVDTEVFRLPPAPAYKAEGEYAEQSSRGDGKRVASCTVRLRGAKGVKQSQLAQVAAGVVFGNLSSRGFTGTGVVLESANYRFQLFDNTVIVGAQIMKPNSTNSMLRGGALISSPQTIDTPQIPNSQQPTYHHRGNAGLLLRAAAYWDPTLRDNKLFPTGEYAVNNPVTEVNGANNQMRGQEVGRAGVEGP